MDLFKVSVVRPLKGRDRVHSMVTFHVMAPSPRDAEELVRKDQAELGYTVEFMTRATCLSEGPHVIGYYTLSKESLRKLRSEPPTPTPAPKAIKHSTAMLGDRMHGVLQSLSNHGKYPGGWVWDTHSGTIRTLERLRLRGLVDRTGNGNPTRAETYTMNQAGRDALERHAKLTNVT